MVMVKSPLTNLVDADENRHDNQHQYEQDCRSGIQFYHA